MSGRFLTALAVMLVDDTAHDGQGTWSLLYPLEYLSNDGTLYIVPAGFPTDFASVPRIPGYALVGNRAHRAAVLHDWLIHEDIMPARDAADLFLEAMESTGVPADIAALMHLAVRSYVDSQLPAGPEGRGHEIIKEMP